MGENITGILAFVFGAAGAALSLYEWNIYLCVAAFALGLISLTDYLSSHYTAFGGMFFGLIGALIFAYQMFWMPKAQLPGGAAETVSEVQNDGPTGSVTLEINDPKNVYSLNCDNGYKNTFEGYLKAAYSNDAQTASSYIVDRSFYEDLGVDAATIDKSFAYLNAVLKSDLQIGSLIAEKGESAHLYVTIEEAAAENNPQAGLGVYIAYTLEGITDSGESLGMEHFYAVINKLSSQWRIIQLGET